MPIGVRIKPNHISPQFDILLARLFFQGQNLSSQFQFVTKLQPHQKCLLQNYITQSSIDDSQITELNGFPKASLSQLYCLRGFIALGIFQHCLTLRCGVQYGVPNSKHHKRVAVPYEAADIPSERSQFSQPQVSIMLSLISYYTKTITREQFEDALCKLIGLNKSYRECQFELWMCSIEKATRNLLVISRDEQINLQNLAQKDQLYQTFHRCRATIAFWLTVCIFPSNLRQYSHSISSSSWDIASVSKSIGFSGTKDSKCLFPTYTKYVSCSSPSIQATDGKMIDLLFQNILSIQVLPQTQQFLWKRLIDKTMNMNASAIIDSGAIFAGRSFRNEIIPYLANHPKFNLKTYQGISYCDREGCWKVLDVQKQSQIERGEGISDQNTFVIFDEARTRGADLKMNQKVVAIISLSLHIGKDKLMQAIGRLRKFGRNQKAIIIMTKDIQEEIVGFNLQGDLIQNIKAVLLWSCNNSCIDNEKFLIQNLRLALNHKKVEIQPFHVQRTLTSLQILYRSSLRSKTIYQQSVQILATQFSHQDHELLEAPKKYGHDKLTLSSDCTQICQRQVVVQKVKEKQVEMQQTVLEAQNQSQNTVCLTTDKFSTLIFSFDQNFKATQNFINVTFCKQVKKSITQLGIANYCLLQNGKLTLLSMRQANKYICNGKCAGPLQIKHLQFSDLPVVVRLYDLTNNLTVVQRFDIQLPLLNATFFNGRTKFNSFESKIIEKLIRESCPCKQKFENYISHFLERRYLKAELFRKSSLHEILIRVTNSIS